MKRNVSLALMALIAIVAVFSAGCGTDSVTGPADTSNRTASAADMDSTILTNGPGDPTLPPTNPIVKKSTWSGIKAIFMGGDQKEDPPPNTGGTGTGGGTGGSGK